MQISTLLFAGEKSKAASKGSRRAETETVPSWMRPAQSARQKKKRNKKKIRKERKIWLKGKNQVEDEIMFFMIRCATDKRRHLKTSLLGD